MERSADRMDQAEGDLERGYYDWACFSAQQAAEKAVKAVLQKAGADAWGHAVAGLFRSLAQVVLVPTELVDAALELDKA